MASTGWGNGDRAKNSNAVLVTEDDVRYIVERLSSAITTLITEGVPDHYKQIAQLVVERDRARADIAARDEYIESLHEHIRNLKDAFHPTMARPAYKSPAPVAAPAPNWQVPSWPGSSITAPQLPPYSTTVTAPSEPGLYRFDNGALVPIQSYQYPNNTGTLTELPKQQTSGE